MEGNTGASADVPIATAIIATDSDEKQQSKSDEVATEGVKENISLEERNYRMACKIRDAFKTGRGVRVAFKDGTSSRPHEYSVSNVTEKSFGVIASDGEYCDVRAIVVEVGDKYTGYELRFAQRHSENINGCREMPKLLNFVTYEKPVVKDTTCVIC